ncbi:MAG: DUF4252 domain-containing protein [Tannerellaceae bacterium]|jgi:hypothetical protein|nr:DUF4252 domain-containing protein [Tannerellaceae bacterium]
MKRKYRIIAALCLLAAGICQAQNKLFDKYADMDNVTYVYISKAMFNMMPTVVSDIGLSLTNMKGKIESLQLVSSEQKDEMEKMRKEFTQLYGRYHQELMRLHSGKTHTVFYAIVDGNKVEDLVMLADTDSTFVAIQILGKFTIKDIQDISAQIDVKVDVQTGK